MNEDNSHYVTPTSDISNTRYTLLINKYKMLLSRARLSVGRTKQGTHYQTAGANSAIVERMC